MKLAACLTMLIDHIGFQYGHLGGIFSVFRLIGRISFPLFAFMIADGAFRTKNKAGYLIRLLVFGVITEPVYDLCFYGKLYAGGHLNVMFTLALGLAAIYVYYAIAETADRFKPWLRIFIRIIAFLPPVLIALLSNLAGTDYGMYGVALIFAFGLIRRGDAAGKALLAAVTTGFAARFLLLYEAKKLVSLTGLVSAPALPSGWNLKQIFAVFAVIFIITYDGTRGPQPSSSGARKAVKNAFYAFYPAHLLLLILIKKLILLIGN